ncbi:MAG TPA: AMIN domain-containing protein, partial [Myxococcales bacterium]|nr:AMIN domain-containing protein [Myxococcales bacterium]
MHMRRMLPVTGLVLFFVLVGMSAAHAIDNRISGIQVEEGPNNTVVTIVGSGTPTFTVFKLLEPVRLLVDIAGASMDQLSGSRQVRNGVVHDIETLQFASNGRNIGRVVIGFDKDAPYSVKSNGNSIRIVIDGTDRRLPKLESQKVQDALNRAKHALESEKKLRIKLQKAEEREAKLRIRHTSMETERKGLTADLAAARQQVIRLEELAKRQKQGRSLNAELLKEAALSAEQKRLAAEKATAVAKAEFNALSEQKRYALAEKNAIEIAIELATKRREMLQKILAAEEMRRTDAERVRVQSDALKKNNHKLELTKSKRAELAAESLHTMEKRRGALEEARRRADRLMKKEQQARKEIAALRSKIQSLNAGDKGSKKRVKLLQTRLSKLERKHLKKLNLLRKSVKSAELKAAQRETEHQNILAQLQNTEARLRRELAAREQSLNLSKSAGESLQRRLNEREKMVTKLIERDKRRMGAIVAAGKARSARIVAEEKMARLRLQKKALTLRIEQLSQMNLDLMALTGKNPASIKSTLAKSKLEVKRIITSLKENEGKGVELVEKLIAEKQSLVATRATLAQEQQDLAAVLQQKNLFAEEAELLQKNNEAERKNLLRLKSEILQSNERLTDLKMKGQFQQQLVLQLENEHERRNFELTRLNKEQEAGELALSKTNQALSKEQTHYKQLFEKRRKEAQLLGQLTEKRKAESWRV